MTLNAAADRATITVTVQFVNGTIPTNVELVRNALLTLEGWSEPEVEDAENGIWNVDVPAETWHTLRHEGWLETWALTPNGDRLMVSAEADDPGND